MWHRRGGPGKRLIVVRRLAAFQAAMLSLLLTTIVFSSLIWFAEVFRPSMNLVLCSPKNATS